jgi:hypothetical protein
MGGQVRSHEPGSAGHQGSHGRVEGRPDGRQNGGWATGAP